MKSCLSTGFAVIALPSAMTEPDEGVLTRNTELEIRRERDEYRRSGLPWRISRAADERCQLFIGMGRVDTDADTERCRQQSLVLGECDGPVMEIVRHLPIFGYQDQHGHSELRFTGCRVPATDLRGEQSGGFAIAPAHLHAWARALRVAAGPDAVHRRTIARRELKRTRPSLG
ncbi:acyl-CoA dehydrogenase family protein [Gephyromycinifex aptenodytis]|uniref:hypothetical protein n=1 Tax=Gephyromycinifex aptenodytis TaxID=2716227 RepID=UPI001447E3ED|nr:hypothetical protein [Gephyromycinifex aptenodytis]